MASRASNLAGFSTSIQSVAPNNLVVGVITATSFVGDGSGLTNAGSTLSAGSGSQRVVLTSLTSGTMTTAATDADLTWNSTTNVLSSPTFSGNITGTAATFTGNVSIAGTLTYEDVTNVDSIGVITARSGIQINTGGLVVTAGVSTFTTIIGTGLTITGISTATDTRFQSVGEKTTRINGNTASLVYNTGGGNVAVCTNPTGDITLAVTGIPTDTSFNDTSITFSVFVNQTGTARSCTAVTLNGASATIRWAGGSLASAISGVTTTSGMDIYSFTGINTVGSASTTTNYYVMGVVNGGYR
jgi:hypothetical protein